MGDFKWPDWAKTNDQLTKLEEELLALLDLIEVNDDATLAGQRFDIFEKHGYTVVIDHETSGRLQ